MMTDKAVTMRVVEAHGFALDELRVARRPIPQPKPGEILIRLRAATLNYRDLALLTRSYRRGLEFERVYVPGSDACGEIVGCGDGVTRFRLGDRVIPTYTQGWISGLPSAHVRSGRTLGFPLDGILREYITVPQEEAVAAPASLTEVEAAALPIAGLTAWTTLQAGQVKPGDWVLALGTGGVALFALQFARAAGAKVALISSSDEKLARALDLGADAVINYRKVPHWPAEARSAMGGEGADIVIETAGTLSKSLEAAAYGGFVGVIGFSAQNSGEVDVRSIIQPLLRIQGMATGSRSSFEAMNRAIDQHLIKPVIDRIFSLDDVRAAFEFLRSGQHFGKIAIDFAH